MSEGYPDVRNFWDDFINAYCEWASNNVFFDDLSPTLWNETYGYYFNSQIRIYCAMYFHAQNCTQCDDLCEIHNMNPCLKLWTDLSEECCQTCDLFVASCEVDECLIPINSIQSTTSSNDDNTTQVLTTSSLAGYTISLNNGNNANFRDSKSFYVLVTLLPICGFIGRGSY